MRGIKQGLVGFGLLLAVAGGSAAIAQEDEALVVQGNVGMLGGYHITLPDETWLVGDEAYIFLTNSERLLPPEEKPDDYETPEPESGEVIIRFSSFTPHNFSQMDYLLSADTTAADLAALLTELSAASAESETEAEVGAITAETIGDYDAAMFDRLSDETQWTNVLIKVDDMAFLMVSTQSAPDEFEMFRDDIYTIIASTEYETEIQAGDDPMPGRWRGSSGASSVSFVVTEDGQVSDFEFSVIIGVNTCTLNADSLPIINGNLVFNEKTGIIGRDRGISNLGIVGTFAADSIAGTYNYALLCGSFVVTSGGSGGSSALTWSATWQGSA